MPVKLLKYPRPRDLELIPFNELKEFVTEEEENKFAEKGITEVTSKSIYERNKMNKDFVRLLLIYSDGTFITEEMLRAMTRDFRNKLPQEPLDPENSSRRVKLAKAAWFSLGELKEFFEKNELRFDHLDGKGVRIYMGLYPYQGSNKDFNATCILVPTLDNEVDGRVCHWDDLRFEAPETYMTLEGGAYNHGELCPTSCDGAVFS